jgi:hypothetical protein
MITVYSPTVFPAKSSLTVFDGRRVARVGVILRPIGLVTERFTVWLNPFRPDTRKLIPTVDPAVTDTASDDAEMA